MVCFTSPALAALAAARALAGPTSSTTNPIVLEKRQNTPNGQGNHDGYFWSWWSDGGAPATYTNLAGGGYRVQWQDGGNLVGGKGWQPDLRERFVPSPSITAPRPLQLTDISSRSIQYSVTYQPNGNSYLAVYGWMRSPLVEYYIVENFGTYDPSSDATPLGEVTCDGATYKLASSWRYNAPSIDSTQTFQQYWSVRSSKRTGGVVNTGCHFDAWARAGLPMGSHDYQIVATEGYYSSGYAEITVADAGRVRAV